MTVPDRWTSALIYGKKVVEGTEEEKRAAEQHNRRRTVMWIASVVVFWGWFILITKVSISGGIWHGVPFEAMATTSSFASFILLMVLLLRTEAPVRKRNGRIMAALSFTAVGFWLLNCYGLSRAKGIILFGPEDYAEIVTDTDTITTNDRVVYIGKLSEVVFLYDRDDSLSTAIPMDQIKRMTLTNNR